MPTGLPRALWLWMLQWWRAGCVGGLVVVVVGCRGEGSTLERGAWGEDVGGACGLGWIGLIGSEHLERLVGWLAG